MRLVLASIALSCLSLACSPLAVTAVTPAEVVATEEQEITIEGVGFSDGVQFELLAPGLVITLVPSSVDDERAVATVPAAVPAGTYDVAARLDGAEAVLSEGLRVIEGETRFVFIDVSQGDATIIIAPDGTTILIDGGKRDAAPDVRLALDDLARGRLDAVVVSHFDADHLGGVVEILSGPDGQVDTDDDIVPGVAWSPSDDNTCGTLVCQDMRRLRVNFTTPPLGETLQFDELTLEVVAVNGDSGAGPVAGANDENERSVVILATFAERRVLITGDLTGGGLGTVDLESPLAERLGPVDIVRVAHHGSATSSPQDALDAYQARAAVFSMGRDNTFCHPETDVFTRWNESGAALYGTRAGIVDDGIRCDGETPIPARGRFDIGDIVLDIDASGEMVLAGDVIAP